MQHEDLFYVHPFHLSRSHTLDTLTNKGVYIHNVVYINYRHEIEYTITNTTDYWHSFGQPQKVFKLMGFEWFAISGSVSINHWLAPIPPRSSDQWSFCLNAFHFFSDITLPEGVYMFLKPLTPSVLCDQSYNGWEWDIHNSSWIHLILEVQ